MIFECFLANLFVVVVVEVVVVVVVVVVFFGDRLVVYLRIS